METATTQRECLHRLGNVISIKAKDCKARNVKGTEKGRRERQRWIQCGSRKQRAMERPHILEGLNIQLKCSFLRWAFGDLRRCIWPKALLVNPKALLIQSLSYVFQVAGLDLPQEEGSSEVPGVPEQAALDRLSGSSFLLLSEKSHHQGQWHF